MMATPYSTSNLINTYRMQRLFPAGQAAIICPIDHGIIFPRELMKGLEEPVKVLNRLKTQGATGFMMSPGLVKQTQVEMGQAGHLSRVMAVDGFYSLTDATKVKLTERLGKIVSDAGKWQMPVMIEPVLLGDPRSPAVVAAEFEVSRIAYDIGADIVKIAFPGPDYTAKLVQELKVPLVIAGGPMTGRYEDAVREIQDAVAAGAQGLIVGRNVWSRSPADAERMMTDIVRIAREHHVRLW
jgi:class I fructose-bisphosphate aldolase